MAQPTHLYLKLNGEDIKGDSTIMSLGREESIECLYFVDSVRTARERSTGQATGSRTYEPILFRKRIDKSSPLLARGLCNNEVAEGVFKFFRPNPAGDGTTQHFFTVAFTGGRVASIKRISPDCIDPASSNEPPSEEVSFVFSEITWTYEDGGVEHHDSWMQAT
jgi:type VI secretion system secreted protein Hcp